MSGILIDVEARTAKAEQNLADINRSLLNIEKSTVKSSEALKGMFRQLGGLAAGAFSLAYIKNVSTNTNNKYKNIPHAYFRLSKGNILYNLKAFLILTCL